MLFVDPGLGGTGYAFFSKICTSGKPLCHSPSASGVYTPKKNLSWENKANHVWDWFGGICASHSPGTVIIEFPELWAGSHISQASAERGDLFKLAYLIGGLGYVARAHGASTPLLIHPQVWKGQLSKSNVIKRIGRTWPTLGKVSDHEADAIGMGLSAQGGL